MVMVLHDLNLALSCAHRVAVLEEGQLRRVGAPEEIYASGVLEKVFRPGPQRGDGEGGAAVPLQPAVRPEGGPPLAVSLYDKKSRPPEIGERLFYADQRISPA